MKQTWFRITFRSFSPVELYEWSADNAVIRARYRRLEEKLSTDVERVDALIEGKWITINPVSYATQMEVSSER